MQSERYLSSWLGSSPRGRGTPRMGFHVHVKGRFIPARAGHTWGRIRARPASAVHPRAGGAHANPEYHHGAQRGSSPRGRGTHDAFQEFQDARRFIPARAGHTPAPPCRSPNRPVHPRAGGAHRVHGQHTRLLGGSSPRGRGTRFELMFHGGRRRFIPARAGHTRPRTRPERGPTVHPRAGGAHEPRTVGRISCSGSSPRGRGTPALEEGHLIPGRFIPARAGHTDLSPPAARSAPVHPRAGGAHSSRQHIDSLHHLLFSKFYRVF